QPGAPLVTAQCRSVGNQTKVKITQRQYFYDGALLERGTNQLSQIPVCLEQARTGNAEGAETCQVLTTREQTVTLPGCSTWVFANAGGHGYYRSGYSEQAVRAMR